MVWSLEGGTERANGHWRLVVVVNIRFMILLAVVEMSLRKGRKVKLLTPFQPPEYLYTYLLQGFSSRGRNLKK